MARALSTRKIPQRIQKESSHPLESRGIAVLAIELAVRQAEVEVHARGLAPHVRIVDVDEQILVESVVAVAGCEDLVVLPDQSGGTRPLE